MSGCPRHDAAAWAKASHLDPVEYARATMPLSFAPGWVKKHPAEFEELLALRLSAPTPAAAWRAQFAACADFLRAGLPAGELPTRSVIVHGTADAWCPMRTLRTSRKESVALR